MITDGESFMWGCVITVLVLMAVGLLMWCAYCAGKEDGK